MFSLKSKLLRVVVSLVLLGVLALGVAGCLMRHPAGVQVERNLIYAEVDDHKLRLDLYRPKHIQRKLPVIIWLYGGGWRMGSKTICPLASYAAEQVAIVSIDYRLDDVAVFPAQIHDCKGAVRWLRANADRFNLDADHLGVFGISAGGHLAALLGTTEGNSEMEGTVGGNLGFSSKVQGVCAFYPPTDLNRLVATPKQRNDAGHPVAMLIGGPVASHADAANFASPIFYVSSNAAPFFLLHGGADRLVPPEQSQLLHEALLRVGVESHLAIIPNKGHGIFAPPEVAREIRGFFVRQLGR
ncbi:MAG: alpha/beta hydrolase [Verrucomicrobiota bacterium]